MITMKEQVTKDSAQLSDAAKEAQNEYQREYRRRNKEKVKQWNKSYWERKAKKLENENKEIEKA